VSKEATASNDMTVAAIGELEREDLIEIEMSLAVIASKLEAITVTTDPPTVESVLGSMERKMGEGNCFGSKQ
jgi:hypothetical protein